MRYLQHLNSTTVLLFSLFSFLTFNSPLIAQQNAELQLFRKAIHIGPQFSTLGYGLFAEVQLHSKFCFQLAWNRAHFKTRNFNATRLLGIEDIGHITKSAKAVVQFQAQLSSFQVLGEWQLRKQKNKELRLVFGVLYHFKNRLGAKASLKDTIVLNETNSISPEEFGFARAVLSGNKISPYLGFNLCFNRLFANQHLRLSIDVASYYYGPPEILEGDFEATGWLEGTETTRKYYRGKWFTQEEMIEAYSSWRFRFYPVLGLRLSYTIYLEKEKRELY